MRTCPTAPDTLGEKNGGPDITLVKSCPCPTPPPPLLIGVSARIDHPDAPVLDLGGVWTKTLHDLEQSVALWLMTQDAVPVMVPAVTSGSLQSRKALQLEASAATLDGLVLQGGADVAPPRAMASSRCAPSGAATRCATSTRWR